MNPFPFGAAHLGQARAERMVKSGRAEWMGERQIRWSESHPYYQNAVRNSIQSAAGYDARGCLRLDEIRNIPVILPQKLFR